MSPILQILCGIAPVAVIALIWLAAARKRTSRPEPAGPYRVAPLAIDQVWRKVPEDPRAPVPRLRIATHLAGGHWQARYVRCVGSTLEDEKIGAVVDLQELLGEGWSLCPRFTPTAEQRS